MGAVIFLALPVTWLTLASGLFRPERWPLMSGLAFSVALFVWIAGCPLTGHHPAGTWLYGSFAGCALGLAASVGVLALTARQARTTDPAAHSG